MAAGDKAPDAFRTIGELSADLGVPQHILRYWETKFPQLRPLQRAGNRRYYRPAEVALARRIHHLLNDQGYTVRGVQKLLGEKPESPAVAPIATAAPDPTPTESSSIDVDRLVDLRDRLRQALAG
ncbi:MAG: MerR family transcriptional regulator [Sphingomicrobium sp.]